MALSCYAGATCCGPSGCVRSFGPTWNDAAGQINVRKTRTNMIKFTDLKLSPKVLKAIEEAGYESPTPIQAGAIPPALEGRDVLGIAQTGTGKTA